MFSFPIIFMIDLGCIFCCVVVWSCYVVDRCLCFTDFFWLVIPFKHAIRFFFYFDPGTCFSLWYVPFFDSYEYYDRHTYMICLQMQCIGCEYICMYVCK